MTRRLLPVLLAGVVLAGVAGCGDRNGAAPVPAPTSAATGASSGAAAAGGSQVDDVAAAVEDAEQLLSSIDAELAADDTDADTR